ncbi:transcription factor MYB1R1-like [Andrographis paniculata]|uniref:transcription factor MYB1R1-like n=1 Tax=Andrographis paniculata TaxID=175694 RepID=UPI0021E89516|nr:transcription factor MYB1R1-like [Andrographis paniculata]
MSLCSESPSAVTSSDGSGYAGSGEFMLFGVRVKVDPMRKCVSMNNLSEYEPASNPIDDEMPKADVDGAGGAGYVSADAVPPPSKRCRERKRGVPWTEEEHKQFLIGLQKVGKGDWRGISKNYVKTRTPTQVASHAQKYFLRRSNLSRRRRRSSLFDITTDLVAQVPTEHSRTQQDATANPVSATTAPPVTSNTCGFSVAPFPVTAGPVLLSMQGVNCPAKPGVLVRPVLAYPSPNQRAAAESSSPSLRLSLSSGQDQPSTRDSSFQVLSTLKTDDIRISVA